MFDGKPIEVLVKHRNHKKYRIPEIESMISNSRLNAENKNM